MNRALQKLQRKRCSYRHAGGAYAVGAPLLPVSGAAFPPVNEIVPLSDCADAARPGALINVGNPALAQAPMAGGARCGCMLGRRQMGGGSEYHYATLPGESVGGAGPVAAALIAPGGCPVHATQAGGALHAYEYPAQSAGFGFAPVSAGAAQFMAPAPYAARMGGARKSAKTAKTAKKSRKAARKATKKSGKTARKSARKAAKKTMRKRR